MYSRVSVCMVASAGVFVCLCVCGLFVVVFGVCCCVCCAIVFPCVCVGSFVSIHVFRVGGATVSTTGAPAGGLERKPRRRVHV